MRGRGITIPTHPGVRLTVPAPDDTGMVLDPIHMLV